MTSQFNPLSEYVFFKCLYVNTVVNVRLFVLPEHVLKGMIFKQITLCVILLHFNLVQGCS